MHQASSLDLTLTINCLVCVDYFNDVFMNFFEVSVLVEWIFSRGDVISRFSIKILSFVMKMNKNLYGSGST